MDTKRVKIFGIIFLILIFLFISVNSILLNVFNNSLSSENITFSENQNITRFIDIYLNGVVTSAYLNLSGYKWLSNGWVKSIQLNYINNSCSGALRAQISKTHKMPSRLYLFLHLPSRPRLQRQRRQKQKNREQKLRRNRRQKRHPRLRPHHQNNAHEPVRRI